MFRLPEFYPILDHDWLTRTGRDSIGTAHALLDAGARIVQLRRKLELTREAFEEALKLSRLIRGAGATFIVNDRADLALMVEADGVHLGQTDLPPAAVRRLAGDRLLIGFSTHNEQQVREADGEPVDYLAFGPIYSTASKRNPDPETGLQGLAKIRRLTTKPLVAIGGINRERSEAAYAAGADSVAVISAIDDWLT